MRKMFFLIFTFGIHFFINAQGLNTFDNSKAAYSPPASHIVDDFERTGSAGATITWHNFNKTEDGSYHFLVSAPVSFTSIGIGWQADNNTFPAADFFISYRSRLKNDVWSKWYSAEGYVQPDETPTNLYWTDLLFLDNEQQHHELEISFTPPQGINIQIFKLVLMDNTNTGSLAPLEEIDLNDAHGIKSCPPFPTIIPRSQWCGAYTACHNTTAYTNITATHTVIHHGAAPDTYTDGAAVVRSYWNYHVNTLGWQDIGYNYLFCKAGFFYQGRHNPNLPNTDVRGSHGGNANNGSIGLNFLGNADVTLPTTIQINKLNAFLAWWYDYKNFDPTSSASMLTQAFGTQVVPRICGHRDIGQTACPGTTLYNQIPSIRTTTKAIIDSCYTPPPPTGPINLQVNVGLCPAPTINFSWTNSGNGWYILLATDVAFTNPYIKWVSGLTSYTGPNGFVLQSNSTTPLVLIEGQSYFWKIWDNNTFTSGPAFTVPICDDVPPTTSIYTQGNWKTQDFIATFTDVDNPGGTGVAAGFYNVLDYDGAFWRGNYQRGFFLDNFEVIDNAIWSVPLGGGTWQIDNNMLVQSDESVSNSNIYAPLDQTLSNKYLYHFVAKVEGAGHPNGRRFGLHYFADNASQTNRGNSYFIFFRLETNKLEFYKVVNNVFSLENVIDDIVIVPNVMHDFKIIFDRITGETKVYKDDKFLANWIDLQPLNTNGQYISFRTGNSKLTVDEINVLRSRQANVNVTVGNASDKDIRHKNTAPHLNAAVINSVAVDSAGNISQTVPYNVHVDWSKPSNIDYVHDGLGADIDTTSSYVELSANWAASADTNSDVLAYWYAIGTTQGDTNIVGWTNNGLNTFVTHSNLYLNFNTTYYFSVKAKNGAGLWSEIAYSNGVVVFNNTSVLSANFSVSQNYICEGDSVYFVDFSFGSTQYEWVFYGGAPHISNVPNPIVVYDSPGVYGVELRVFDNQYNSDSLILPYYITVNAVPKASFYAVDSVLYLPNTTAFFNNNSTNAQTYLWSFGNSNFSTDDNPWFQYNIPGFYSVELIAYNNFCKNDTITKPNYIQVVDASGLSEVNSGFSLNLLNNPVGNDLKIQIHTDKPMTLSFEMADILGRTFFIEKNKYFEEGNHIEQFSLSNNMASGIYYLRIVSDSSEQVVLKFFKQ